MNRNSQWIGDDEKPAGTDAHPTETGLININTATMEQLQALPGVDRIKARDIVAARPYKNPEDIMRVKGFDQRRAFDNLRDKITVR